MQGTLEHGVGHQFLRVERWLASSPQELWRALIQHSELGEQGPMLRLALAGGVSATAGKIMVYDSQKTLECAWGGGILRWELQACGGMTRFIFTHTCNELAAAPDVREWAAWLDSL
jgi:hypothetical protein